MSFQLRMGTIILFLAAYILSYKYKKIEANIRIITFFLCLLAVLELFYYTYSFEFQLVYAVLTILVIAMFNLIFKAELLKLNANIILGLIIFTALILVDKPSSFKAFYYASYLLTAFLSYLVSYNIQKYNQNLKKKILEQDMILDTIDLQIWYLKNEKKYGKANKAHAEFLGIEKEKIVNKEIDYFLSEDEADICRIGNRRVFNEKKKITLEERTKNSKGIEKILLITKNPKLDKEGEVEYVVCSAKDITEEKKREVEIRKNRVMLENLADQIPGAIYQFQSKADGSYFFPYFSKGIYDLYEIYPEKNHLKVNSIFARISELDYTHFLESIKESKENLTIWHQLYQVDLPQKGLRWIESDAQPEKLADGEVLWHGYTRDITERKKQKDKLELQYKFQKTLAEISSELVNVSLENIDQKLNQSLKKIGEFFSLDQSSIYKLNDRKKYFQKTHCWPNQNFKNFDLKTKKLAADYPWLLEKLQNKKPININNIKSLLSEAEKNFFKNKEIKSAVMIPIIINRNIFGFFLFNSIKKRKVFTERELNLFQILTDVVRSAISKNLDEKKIEQLTYYDSLTGLYNRRFFEEEMKRLDTKRKMPISLIIADINGLKIINDSYGHQKGDEMLKKAAKTLKISLRSEDILSRQGGDEFAILLPNTGEKEVEKIIKRIKLNIVEANNDELPLSIALGSATKKDFEKDIELVLKKADDQMYKNKLSESRSSKSSIVHGLLNILDAKSHETKEHTVRMRKLAFDFGEKLALSNSELNRLSLLATLHDIGKTNIDEKILNKKGKLNSKEWEIIKKHSEQGYKIAASSEEFSLVAEDIFAHHEKWDGSGYPNGLKGKEIPYLARIITIIDAYDVMTHDRSYQKAISKKEALAEIERCAGSQFDPELAKIFIEMTRI